MLDPLTAISLASAIVRFVDFGSKVVGGAYEIYQSVDGALKENSELKDSTSRINELSDRILLHMLDSASGAFIPEDNIKLGELAKTSKDVAGELLSLLRDFKSVRRSGSHKRWESFRKAVSAQTPWNKQKSQVLSLLNRLADHEVDRRSREILDAVKQQDVLINFANITRTLNALVERVHEDEINNVLSTLDFATRTIPEANIEEAYGKSFEWIFSKEYLVAVSPCRMDFRQWLESAEGIFWISGKAGSGKSTVMRYIRNETRTLWYLQDWSNDQKLFIASHFFFNAGESLQKSQQGLIRSILFDIFSQCPNLIPLVVKARLHDHYERTRPWKTSELRDICRALTQESVGMKFCFFVDGLDEYEGEHRDVIDALRDLAMMLNIKLCVSSRPWNVFQKSFGSMEQQLVLEDHTENDIILYVKERLGKDQRFVESARENPLLEALVGEIIEKAQGVFLWVRLMVSDLLHGSANQDNISDLQQRLRFLPPNLETFYQCAFNQIDNFYRQTTAEILLLAEEAIQPLNLLSIAFYEVEKQNPNNTMGVYHTMFKFVRRPEMKEKLKGWVSEGFNPRRTLLSAILAQVKLEPSYRELGLGAATFKTLVSQFLCYAHRLEKYEKTCDVALLDEFDIAAQQCYSPDFQSARRVKYSHWTGFWGDSQLPNPILPHTWNNFLTVAIDHELQLYVSAKVSENPMLLHNCSGPLPLYNALAISTLKGARPDLGPRNSIGMTKMLLEWGAQPHEQFHLPPRTQNMTAFGVFLGQLYEERRIGTFASHKNLKYAGF